MAEEVKQPEDAANWEQVETFLRSGPFPRNFESDSEDEGYEEVCTQNAKLALLLLPVFKKQSHVPSVCALRRGTIKFSWRCPSSRDRVTCCVYSRCKGKEVDLSKYPLEGRPEWRIFSFSAEDRSNEEAIGQKLQEFLQSFDTHETEEDVFIVKPMDDEICLYDQYEPEHKEDKVAREDEKHGLSEEEIGIEEEHGLSKELRAALVLEFLTARRLDRANEFARDAIFSQGKQLDEITDKVCKLLGVPTRDEMRHEPNKVGTYFVRGEMVSRVQFDALENDWRFVRDQVHTRYPSRSDCSNQVLMAQIAQINRDEARAPSIPEEMDQLRKIDSQMEEVEKYVNKLTNEQDKIRDTLCALFDVPSVAQMEFTTEHPRLYYIRNELVSQAQYEATLAKQQLIYQVARGRPVDLSVISDDSELMEKLKPFMTNQK